MPVTFAILLDAVLSSRAGTARSAQSSARSCSSGSGRIAVLGVREIARAPEILRAVNPWYGVQFFVDPRLARVLHSRLRRARGHRSRGAVRGHGALRAAADPARVVRVRAPGAAAQLLRPGRAAAARPDGGGESVLSARAALVSVSAARIATAAAIVASQALISGAFSLTQQAVQLGYMPARDDRPHVEAGSGADLHPAGEHALMVGVPALVVIFRSSSALAAAYGIAVTGTMVITTILFAIVARERWGWSTRQRRAAHAFFLAIDLAFFARTCQDRGRRMGTARARRSWSSC